MKHYQSFNIRKKMIFKIKQDYQVGGLAKFVLKNKPQKKSKRWVTMAKKHRSFGGKLEVQSFD